MTSPWATGDAWRNAPYPRVAVVDDDRIVFAEGSRRSFVAPPSTSAAASLAAVPDDAIVVGCARFCPAPDDDVDPAWAPFGGALWFEPQRREIVAWPPASPGGSATRSAKAKDVVDVVEVVDVVDLDGPRFRDGVAQALAMVRDGSLEKVVLARRFFVPWVNAFERVPRLWSSLLSMSEQRGGTAFLVAPASGSAFLGLSPERLVVVDDDVRTDAVAGTRPRERAAELAESAKDAREHALVVDHLRAALSSTTNATSNPTTNPTSNPTTNATTNPTADERADAGDAVRVGERGVRAVGAVAHLHTVVRAPRTPSTRVDALVAALHPTPAVAGWPVAAAQRALATLERFDRGVYGGVIGVVGPRRSSLSVALRGALVTDAGLSITVGAGVVFGSTVDGEDAETRLKLDAVLASFGLRRGAP